MLGGMIIGVAEQLTIGYLSSAFQDLIVLSVLVLFMLFRPTGLLGSPAIQKV
jgi:branched-chain amino acid transport system permease protein